MAIAQQQVAERAGVSRTTVSIAMNDPSTMSISEKTRRRVLKAAEELGYKHKSRALHVFRTRDIGVFLRHGVGGMFRNPFYGPVFEGIQKEALRDGFHIIFALPENNEQRPTCSLIAQRKCDGLILMGQMEQDLLDEITLHRIPAVNISGSPPGVESVIADNIKAARIAVDYLAKKGHSRIVYLSGQRHNINFSERYEGFRLAMLDHGLSLDPKLVKDVPGTIAGGAEVAEALMQHRGRFTAIVASNDATAVGLLWELRERDVKVPQDISIIGIDNIEDAKRANLTTVDIPKEQMGRLAVKRLMDKIRGDDGPAIRNVLDVHLVERTSVSEVV